jgi:hypothetical protein
LREIVNSLLSNFASVLFDFDLREVKALSKQERPILCCDAWFLHVFFEFASAACCKKRHAQMEHHNKGLAVLILSEL